MKIPSLSAFLCIGGAYGLSQSRSHSNPSTPSIYTGTHPQDIHSLLQASNVSANADLCQYSATYQCVGSTVNYGVNSSADLTAYVFSEQSGVRIYQEDIDSLAMTFGEAAIANAGNDVNSTSASLEAYSQAGELAARVTVSDPDMQLVQLKAVRTSLKNMAVPDGKIHIIFGQTIIIDDGYSPHDDYSHSQDDYNQDDYSNSYSGMNNPLMIPFAATAGALVVAIIAVCVLGYYTCRRQNDALALALIAENQRLLSLLESYKPVTSNLDNISNIENGPEDAEGAQTVSSDNQLDTSSSDNNHHENNSISDVDDPTYVCLIS